MTTKTEAIFDLIGGYESYAAADELRVDGVNEESETTPYCISATISWISGRFISKTVVEGC